MSSRTNDDKWLSLKSSVVPSIRRAPRRLVPAFRIRRYAGKLPQPAPVPIRPMRRRRHDDRGGMIRDFRAYAGGFGLRLLYGTRDPRRAADAPPRAEGGRPWRNQRNPTFAPPAERVRPNGLADARNAASGTPSAKLQTPRPAAHGAVASSSCPTSERPPLLPPASPQGCGNSTACSAEALSPRPPC